MKNLSLKICLVIAALFGSVGGGFALPTCKGSPTDNEKIIIKWDNCIGTKIWETKLWEDVNRSKRIKMSGYTIGRWSYGGKIIGKWDIHFGNGDRYFGYMNAKGWMHGFGKYTWADGTYYKGNYQDAYRSGKGTYRYLNGTYIGEFDNDKRNGAGVYYYNDGMIREGIWKNDNFHYAQKTPYSKKTAKPSVLRTAFVKLSKEHRKQLQSNLRDLGFYKSSIDGLYGKGTAGALTTYNKKHLGGSDLKKSENVEKLINAVLALKTSPKPKIETVPVPIVKAPTQDDDTYKVASGTGFYVSDKGHIITNHHVIEGCEDMKVHSKGNVLETTKISEDRRNDLALLKTTETPKHSFALSTESPFPLQDIVVAGYPFGEKVSSTLKFTQGIVSSIAGLGNDYSQIQIDAALQPGNSGGPILDEYGNVVAVAVAKLSLKKILKDFGVVPENTNFGVKASAVRNLMEGNGVSFKSPNTEVISKRELSQVATDGTVYLTCWMTTAQIEKMRARKVLFEDLE
jgi:S1-C subfamily serine protease